MGLSLCNSFYEREMLTVQEQKSSGGVIQFRREDFARFGSGGSCFGSDGVMGKFRAGGDAREVAAGV